MLYKKLQEYLRNTANPLGVIHEEKKVFWVAHKLWPDLILFKYDIGADFRDPVVCASRGIILDSTNDWEVVSYSYDKFFNYGESTAAVIDWKTAVVTEKLDGSLTVLYNYKDTWCVQTSGSPDASGPVNGTDMDFATLFWRTFFECGYSVPKYDDSIWIFELCCKENKIVVQYDKPRLVLHAVRERSSGYREIPIEDLSTIYEKIKTYPTSTMGNLAECLAAAEALNPVKTEGFVVVDGNRNRVKIKSPKYVVLHHLRDKVTAHGLIDIIRGDEIPEVALYWPELAKQLEEMEASIVKAAEYLEDLYCDVLLKISSLADDKEGMKVWANYISGWPDQAYLFARRRGKIRNARAFLDKMTSRDLADYLKKA